LRSFTSGSEERHVNNEDEDTNPPVTLLPPGKVSFPDHLSETQAGFAFIFTKLTSLSIWIKGSFLKRQSLASADVGIFIKASHFPPTLTSLKLKYPAAMISLSKLEKLDFGIPARSYVHRLYEHAHKLLSEEDSSLFLPLHELLPRLRILTLRYQKDSKHRLLWPNFSKVLPASLEQFYADNAYWFRAGDDLALLPPHLNTLKVLHEIKFNQGQEYYLPPITSLNLRWGTFPLSSQLSNKFDCLISLQVHTLQCDYTNPLPPGLTRMITDNYRDASGQEAVPDPRWFPRGLRELSIPGAWANFDLSHLPPSLRILRVTLCEYGKVPFAPERLKQLPPSLTRLTLEGVYKNFNSLYASYLPRQLVYLTISGSYLCDDLIPLLPKGLVLLKCSGIRFTGIHLSPGTKLVSPQKLLDSINNIPSPRIQTNWPPVADIISYCPSTATRIEHIPRWAIEAKALPRSLLTITRSFNLTDNESMVQDLPPSIRRIWSSETFRLKTWMLFPKTLTKATHAKILFESDDVDLMLDMINRGELLLLLQLSPKDKENGQADGSVVMNPAEDLQLPDTLGSLLWPRDRLLPCPKTVCYQWNVSHFTRLPQTLTRLAINGPVKMSEQVDPTRAAAAVEERIPLPPALHTLSIEGWELCLITFVQTIIPPTLTCLRINPGPIPIGCTLFDHFPMLPQLEDLTVHGVNQESTSNGASEFWRSLPSSITKLAILSSDFKLSWIVDHLPPNITDLSIESIINDVPKSTDNNPPDWNKIPNSLQRLHLHLLNLPRSFIDRMPLSITSLRLAVGSESLAAHVLKVLEKKRTAGVPPNVRSQQSS
jgi:hypothetical protein